jgi:hypothetical protein
MSERKYKITPSGEWFKVEVSDEYNNHTVVYKKNVIQASLFITEWWEDTEKREKSNNLLAKAILNCKEIDSNNKNLRSIL